MSEQAQQLGLSQGESAAEFLGSLLTSFPGFVTRIDSCDRIRYINRTAGQIDLEEVIGSDVFDFISPEHHAAARACFARVRETAAPQRYEAVAGAGEQYFHYINYVSLVRDPDGGAGLCIIGVDVTEQKVREQALRENQELLELVKEATDLATWDWNIVTGEVIWDARMRQILGRDEPVTLERYVAECVHPDDREMVRRTGTRALSGDGFSAEVCRIVRPDGEVRWTMSSGSVTFDDGKPVRFLGSMLDITDKQRTELQLRRAQKMEAVGTLSAGVAHNFNNMLMVMMPCLQLLEGVVPQAERHLLQDAQWAAERAATLVRQLMTFSGLRQSGALEVRDIMDLVSQSVRMARQAYGHSIVVRTHEEPVPPVLCDAGAIQQVVMNILLNARDAFRNAKTQAPAVDVFIDQATSMYADEADESPRGRGVRIRIRDNGPGMAEEVRTRIFEPFFTTREAEGTGLGLSTSMAIVAEHGGHLSCTSPEGEGAELTIWLPAAPDAPVSTSSEPADSRPPLRRVLLVDDDRAVRRVVTHLLGGRFDLIAAASVPEAEALLRKGESFDAALIDQAMPAGTGELLVPQLRRACPGCRILYFTGGHVERPEEVDGVLSKPVSRQDLLEALSAVDPD